MGAAIDVKSPIEHKQFVKEMVESVNVNAADPRWSGWYEFMTVEGKEVSVRLRSIDAIERLE